MLRIKKEKDKNRYKSSQLSHRNYIHSLRCSELKFFSTVLVFLKLRWNEAFWATRCRYNVRGLSFVNNKVFRIFRTNTQTRIQKTVHVYSHPRADMFAMHCSSSGLGASRFFLGAPFSSIARVFFLCARFLFANKTSNLLTEMFRSSS